MPAKGQDRMPKPIFIARLIDPLLVGIGMRLNGDVYRLLAGQLIKGYQFIYFSGLLAMAAALAILNAYHAWTSDWRSVITALGWLLLGIGTFRILGLEFVTFVGGSIISPACSSPAPTSSSRVRRLHHLQELRGVSAIRQSETRS